MHSQTRLEARGPGQFPYQQFYQHIVQYVDLYMPEDERRSLLDWWNGYVSFTVQVTHFSLIILTHFAFRRILGNTADLDDSESDSEDAPGSNPTEPVRESIFSLMKRMAAEGQVGQDND